MVGCEDGEDVGFGEGEVGAEAGAEAGGVGVEG